VRLVAIMFVAMAAAALAVDAIFSGAHLIPSARPSIDSITERAIGWNYTTFLNTVFFRGRGGALFTHASPRCAESGLRDDRRPHDALPV
jgi:hypothetical protein